MARIVPKLNLNKTPELVDNHSLIFAKNIRFNANGLSSDYGFDEVVTDYDIVGIIPYNTKFYILTRHNGIYQYDEENESIQHIPTRWSYSGGKIDGECSVNLRGDILLTIAEAAYGVPLKTINITEHLNGNISSDESFYTQAPEIPFYHLTLDSLYNKPIPAGTYQFFIRYEIYENCYTDWFPASKELFAGYSKNARTNQGGLKYIDTKVDSSFSFKFAVDKIYQPEFDYKSFQLGFIIAHDDEVYGRAYKHFDLSVDEIYFDYDTEYVEEIDVKDLLYPTYDLYNVGNITEYKNKLYISNYEETNFNPDTNTDTPLADYASSIHIDLGHVDNLSVEEYNDGTPITIEYNEGIPYITKINNNLISSIVEFILTENQSILFGTDSIDGYRNFETNHVKVSVTKTVLDISEASSINPIEDEYYHITNLLDDTISVEHTILDTKAYIAANTEYIIATTGAFRPNKSLGAPIAFNIEFNKTIDNVTYNCILIIRFYTDNQNININSTIENSYTLVPYQTYSFYAHFVTAKGEITNGYLIGSKSVEEIGDSPIAAIYPIFSNIGNLPNGYKAFFISILHTDNLVAQVFDIHNISIEGIPSKTIGDCLELDTILYSGLSNLEVRVNGTPYTIDYKASYDNSYPVTFGSSGKCVFQDKLTNDEIVAANGRGFLIIPYHANPKYAVLIKCTPWIIPNANVENGTYDNYVDLNLLGYLSEVKKPLDNLNRYYSGSDVYGKTVSGTDATGYQIAMSELNVTPGSNYDWLYTLLDSNSYIVYSNFNLNFLALSNNITERIISKTNNGNTTKYIVIAFDSILLSEVYTLPSMYYSYTRRTYLTADDKSIVKFTNTIRSSVLEGDEAKVYRYKFLATDYYNVPTDKGIIINLVAVGDNILVHTQDSIYKFSGQNSLTAAGGEDVQMKESEVFDTGIQELFGSEFGYAGLASKEHQILSEFGYTFWDRDSGRIYLYTGNAQMKVLSDDISKLLRRTNITNIHLADDYYNNRIFICVEFEDNKVATLSYDFVAKSFISVHDFTFNWHFKTKTKCYFVHNNHDVYKVGTEIGSYGPFLITDFGVYPKHNAEDCIIDVIFNDRFEVIKTLNTIEWICNKIIGFDTEINMVEETFSVTDVENRYKGDYLRLYSDSCMTDKLDIRTRSNDERLRSTSEPFNFKPAVDSYKQVRYNLGKWTFNYFRNILNRNQNPTNPRTLARDDTLIYGKYFVARFVFDRSVDFRFEDVSFNISTDYNI